MTDDNTAKVILELATEDSYAFPEIVSRIAGLRTEITRGEVRQLVRDCTRDMCADGLLDVTRLDSPGGRETVLSSAAALDGISDDLEWMEGYGWRSHLRVVATELGRVRYLETK